MCASYGIDGLVRPERSGSRVRFESMPPLHTEQSRSVLASWADAGDGRARITGRLARNLNPLIFAPRGERELALGWWWLHVGARPAEYSAFNSRDDRLLASWHEPFQRRALLPATWYVEKGRTFGLPGGELFGIAAITTTVPQAEGGALVSYSMVTRGAVAAAAEVHPRMPLILPVDFHDTWLDPGRAGDQRLVAEAQRVSEELCARVRPLERPEPAAAPAQPTLF